VRRGREAAVTAGELEVTDDEQGSGSEGLLPSTGGEACRHPVRGRTGNGRDDETGPRETAARDLIGAAPTVEVEIGLDPTSSSAWPPATARGMARSRKLSSMRVPIGPAPSRVKRKAGGQPGW
jgi:hypothetical protein